MKKKSNKQKIIILISIFIIIVIIGLVIGINAIKVNVANKKYNSSNSSSNNGNLLPEYIKEGITLAGVTGTLQVLDTSDATATDEDILYGKTAYVDGKKITGTYRTLGMLQVGDYIEYIPDTAKTSYSLSKSYSGYDTDQTITKEKLSWRILSINNDGTVDLVSAESTSENIHLQGATGYNNVVFLLNDISAKLYSNSSLGATARSITFEDIEKHMTKEGIEYVHTHVNDNIVWGQTRTYTLLRYYPNLYDKENGSGIDTSQIKNNGIEPSDAYYSSPSTDNPAYSQASSYLTVTKTFFDMSMNSSYYDNSIFYDLIHGISTPYLLASRYVGAAVYNADFGVRFVSNSYFNGDYLYVSSGENCSKYGLLRPVVTLDANTKIGSGDGKSSTTAYKIIG